MGKQEKTSITFEKQIGDNYYVVTYVSDKSNRSEVQTMYEMTQKKNSATVSDAKIPRLTPETNSGTNSLYVDDNTNLNNSQIIPLTKNLQNVENNNVNTNTIDNNMEVNNIFSNQIDEVLKEHLIKIII